MFYRAGSRRLSPPPPAKSEVAATRRPLKNWSQNTAKTPEAITGGDVASRLVKSIRRIAQLRRRLSEIQQQMDAMQQTEIFYLKQTIEETEAMGGDPLGDLAKQLMQQLSERKIQLEIARQE